MGAKIINVVKITSVSEAVEKLAYVLAALIAAGFFAMIVSLMGLAGVLFLIGLAAILGVVKIGFLWMFR
jgi:hypothetical protein